MADETLDSEEAEWSDWEKSALAHLKDADLPAWEYKAQAATYAQGHRGILDLDLDFPSAHLKEPTEHCYVWKIAIEEETRVHAYATASGGLFHLKWLEGPRDKSQSQPEHLSGRCARDSCDVCQAAATVAAMTGSS